MRVPVVINAKPLYWVVVKSTRRPVRIKLMGGFRTEYGGYFTLRATQLRNRIRYPRKKLHLKTLNEEEIFGLLESDCCDRGTDFLVQGGDWHVPTRTRP